MDEIKNDESGCLADWGEFRVLNEIVLPILRNGSAGLSLGDDCAFLPLIANNQDLVVTTDAGPKPLAWSLGHHSYWTWGWYSVVANASDLAAAGAVPIGFTTSVEAPREMKVDLFKDFFFGMDAACREFGLQNAGGNVRVAASFACHGTALGTIPPEERISRSNCKVGDFVVAIGKCGYFISSYLKALRLGIESINEQERDALLKPRPQLHPMQILRSAKILSSATDNSDGILGSLWNIVERSNVSIDINLDIEVLPDYVIQEAVNHSLDPRNLFLFWGDWQVIATVKGDKIHEFSRIVENEGIESRVIGSVANFGTGLYGIDNGDRRRLSLLRNENFIQHSFNSSPVSHLEYMLKTNIYE